MPMAQMLATVSAKLQDPATGLGAKGAAFASALGLSAGDATQRIRTDFFFEDWLLSGKLRPTDAPQIAVRPRRWAPQLREIPGTIRKADATVEIVAEFVSPIIAVIEDNASVISMALMQCLDELRDWSDAHSGTVKMVRDPVDISFGTFDGGATRGGFIAVASLLEESSR